MDALGTNTQAQNVMTELEQLESWNNIGDRRQFKIVDYQLMTANSATPSAQLRRGITNERMATQDVNRVIRRGRRMHKRPLGVTLTSGEGKQKNNKNATK